MPLDLHYLQVFKALLSECSISQAANLLQTSPSNVKRILSSLEGEVGIPLFDGSRRGRVEPTPNAELLEHAMQPFLLEMESFRSLASEVREKERVVLVGAGSWVRSTDYFHKWLESLRGNGGIEVRLLEIEQASARAMVDTGACDVYVGPGAVSGKRLSGVELPMMRACIGLAAGSMPPQHPRELASFGAWGVHLPGMRTKAEDWLKSLETAGAEAGRLVSRSEFQEWLARPSQSSLKMVIAPVPAASIGNPGLAWHPFVPLDGIRMTATALSQHPYDFLGAALRAAVANLMDDGGTL